MAGREPRVFESLMIGLGNNIGAIHHGDHKGLIILGMRVAVACYFIARVTKGSMRITIGRKSVNPGERIAGTLNLEVRKALLADRLYVALVGEREQIRRTAIWNSTSIQTRMKIFLRCIHQRISHSTASTPAPSRSGS